MDDLIITHTERIDEVVLADLPSARERELYLRRRVRYLQERADATERVPDWLLLVRALQGTE